jgi:hypothetical protein
MDESLKFILNEDKDSIFLTKANLFVGKNPKIQKITMLILNQMKFILSKF